MISRNFDITQTNIEGVFVIEPKVFGDHRGYFLENYSKRDFEACGLDVDFIQINQSKSVRGVLRGLHYQTKHPQGKLVSVIKGEVYDVAVDIRKSSPTYGNYVSIILTEENKKSFYIPPGFAHGFLVMSEEAIFMYQTTDYYYPEYDAGIIYNDPTINIDWPVLENVILSDKDSNLPLLKDSEECYV